MHIIKKIIFIIFLISLSINIFSAMIITKSVNKVGASLGSTLTYIIYYENTGPSDLTGVNLWDTIPQRTTFLSATSGSVNSGVWQLNIGNLTNGSAGSVTITVQIDNTLNTLTANIRNVAVIESNEEGVKESFPVFTTVVKVENFGSGSSTEFVTFGAWEDNISKNMGFVHIYTLADDTTLKLYYANNVGTSMTNLPANPDLNGTNSLPAGRVIDYPSDTPTFNGQTGDNASSNGFNTTFFKLVSSKPILWIFDSIVDDNWSDSFIFAMSTDYKFTGSTFFVHLYYDRNPTYTYHATDKNFGDSLGVININDFDVAAYIYFSPDNGQTWYLKATNTVKGSGGNPLRGGIWVYGGTTQTEEGDYKIIARELDNNGNDVGDAKVILWKGNLFAGDGEPNDDTDRDSDHDNNNAFAISIDGNKISKEGSDILYGCISTSDEPSTGRGELVITNIGSTTAVIDVYKYKSDATNDRDALMPYTFGNSGYWEDPPWQSNLSIPPNSTVTIYNGSGTTYPEGEYYGSFIKIVLKSGGPIQAIGGANILNAHYGQADYLEAVDTNISVGQEFYFGNSDYVAQNDAWGNLKFWEDNRGGVFIALCPVAGTTVRIEQGSLVDIGAAHASNGGVAYYGTSPLIQTTTGPDQALRFYSIDRNQTYKITADNKIYLMIQNLKGREKVFSGVVVPVTYLYPVAEVEKSADKSVITSGDTVTYTITFDNKGQGGAYDVTIIDTLPGEAEYISSEPSANVNGNVLQWNIPYIAAGDTSSVTVSVRFTLTGTGIPITNTAIAYYKDSSGDTQQPAEGSCVITIENLPVFTLQKSANPDTVEMLKTITYTIHYKNVGLADASNVVLWDTLPDKHIFISADNCGGSVTGTYNSSTNLITWNIGNVNVGEEGDVCFTAQISEDIAKEEHVKNKAMLNCSERNTIYESNEVDVTLKRPPLDLKIITNYPNPFVNDTTIVFNLSIKADVTLKVFTISGELIRTIDNIEGKIGENKIKWDGKNDFNQKVSSGIYIYKIEAIRDDEKKYDFSKLAVMR